MIRSASTGVSPRVSVVGDPKTEMQETRRVDLAKEGVKILERIIEVARVMMSGEQIVVEALEALEAMEALETRALAVRDFSRKSGGNMGKEEKFESG